MTGAEIRKLFTENEIDAIHSAVLDRMDSDHGYPPPAGPEQAELDLDGDAGTVDGLGDPDALDEDYLAELLFNDDSPAAEAAKAGSGARDDKWHADLVYAVGEEFGGLSTMESRSDFASALALNGQVYKRGTDAALTVHVKVLHALGHVTREVMEKVLSARTAMTSMAGMSSRQAVWQTLTSKYPFGVLHPVEINLEGVAEELDRTVYGMEHAKRKIMEHLALLRYSSSARTEPVLLVGGPGTGKTHLGRAVAGALGLPFEKIQMAGAHDVSAYKGCAPTWSSAAPGLLFRMLVDAQCENPVVLVDEIDKAGATSAGSMSSLMVELFDPTQNHEYVDAFMGFPVDFSKVFFVATANDERRIPSYILDRCHVIDVPDYTREERKVIIRRYLPSQLLKETGLKKYTVTVGDAVAGRLSAIASLRAAKMALKSLLVRELRRTDGMAENLVIDDPDEDVLGEYGRERDRSIGFNR